MNKYDEKYTKCPACQAENIIHYHDDFRGNAISLCNVCKVQFMNPVYSEEYLNDYYSHYIPSGYDPGLELRQYRVAKNNFSVIEKFIDEKGLMLDFGVGDGSHANLANQNGWQVTAYDVDCVAMKKLKEDYGFDVYCDDFFDLPLGKNEYKLIYANQVLEHLKNPAKHLDYFRELLTDKGYLFISVPNIKSTSNRIKFFLEKMKLRRKNIGKYYDTSHHVFYYDQVSLRNMLEKNGYSVIYTRSCMKPREKSPKFWMMFSNNVTEKFYSTSTFMMVAKKN